MLVNMARSASKQRSLATAASASLRQASSRAPPIASSLLRTVGLVALLLAVFAPEASAQASSSESEAPSSAEPSESGSQSQSASSSHASSSSPAPVPTPTGSASAVAPTLNVTDLHSNFTLPVLNRTHPAVVVQFPQELNGLSVVFNIASLGANKSEIPRVFVSTGTDGGGTGYDYTIGRGKDDPASGGTWLGDWNRRDSDRDAWEISWDQGFGNWTYGLNWRTQKFDPDAPSIRPSILVGRGIQDDIMLDPSAISDGNVEVFVLVSNTYDNSTGIPGMSAETPLLGDTTSSSVLLFSPVLLHESIAEPQYPNYTLPKAEVDLPQWDEADTVTRNTRFVILPTELSPASVGLGNSIAAIDKVVRDRNLTLLNATRSGTQWMNVENFDGFRYWGYFQGLQPETNYTAWLVEDNTFIKSEPSWFATKEATFACPIVLPNAMCPGIGYASPVAELNASGDGLTAIPEPFAQVLEENLQGFEVSLNTMACGRDRYSWSSTCLDCYMAYRDWLCRIVLPQCASNSPPEFMNADPNGPTSPFVVPRTNSSRRNPDPFPAYTTDYNELQPCISTCTAVDRKCPPTLSFDCPHRNFNANESYAFIGKSNAKNDGVGANGWPATDVWGNRWCNA
ncbi:stretch-activated cation channel mid1 [Vanrija albida]|uniref:Stretch-activated cation channel mid1 n=1 Tax=Vanrija albida TaxID=181172 RepID=A0ABR3PS55_9TREE